MDERKSVIKELENKKRTLADTRSRLLEGLGETLLQRIERESLPEPAGESPGTVLAEYRKLQKDIAGDCEIIKYLELDIQKLKKLEVDIAAKGKEQSRIKEELRLVYTSFGMALLNAPDSNDLAGLIKQQEESLLSKIEEHEKILGELEDKSGGIVTWLGKNAKVAVEKAVLLKSRTDLQKLYRRTGEEYFSVEHAGVPDGVGGEDAKRAMELKGIFSSLSEEIIMLKEERRRIGTPLSTEGTPSQRIQKYQKHIIQVKKLFPALYLRFGSLAAASDGKEVFSSFLTDDDMVVLGKAEALASQFNEEELSIKKINAAINVDKEKAGIEKMEKAISAHRQKVTDAEKAIVDLTKQIEESARRVKELEAFVQGEHGNKD